MARMQHLMHTYLFGVSINKMLILQLKIFLSVKFMFNNNTNVHYFHCRNSSDVCTTSYKKRILKCDINRPEIKYC